MTKIEVTYSGELHTTVTHGSTGQQLHTDAPLDNHGKGATFSPTDLVAAALGSCITTVLGIASQPRGWDLTGMRLAVEKEMSTTGLRRIASLAVDIWIPIELDEKERWIFERIAHSCPVDHSLHPETKITIQFHWKD